MSVLPWSHERWKSQLQRSGSVTEPIIVDLEDVGTVKSTPTGALPTDDNSSMIIDEDINALLIDDGFRYRNLENHRQLTSALILEFEEDDDGDNIDALLLWDLLSSEPVPGISEGHRERAAAAVVVGGACKKVSKVFVVKDEIKNIMNYYCVCFKHWRYWRPKTRRSLLDSTLINTRYELDT